jgi:hypothetical protein
MNLSQLATADKVTLAIAEAQGQVKVTRLAAAKPRRGQLTYTAGYRSGGYRASGQKVRGGGGCNSGRNNVVS